MTLALTLLLSLSAAAPAKGAKAKPPPKTEEAGAAANDPSAKAKELFTRAQKLYAQARYQEAIVQFEEAYLVKPHPVIFYNIGKCWEQLGETAKALRAYRDYLRLLPDASDKDTVADAIANLERRLKERGVQQLMVFADPSTAKIEVDGKALGSSPASVELNAGNHTISVKADGYETVERSFVMSTQRATEMTITLRPAAKEEPLKQPTAASAPSAEPAPAAATAPVSTVTAEEQPKRKGRIFTWVAAGLGVVGLGSGITFGVLTLGAQNKLQTADPMRTRMQADQLVSSAQTMALVTNISWGVAAAAAVVAVVLFFLEGR